MPIAKGPGRSLYMATIVSAPCEGGFKATVLRVLWLPRGLDVPHDIPDHFAKSKTEAERDATARFNVWATLQRLCS